MTSNNYKSILLLATLTILMACKKQVAGMAETKKPTVTFINDQVEKSPRPYTGSTTLGDSISRRN